MRMGENPNFVSAGEVTSQITFLPSVLTLASSRGSGVTCQLLAEKTEYLSCVALSSRRGKRVLAEGRHQAQRSHVTSSQLPMGRRGPSPDLGPPSWQRSFQWGVQMPGLHPCGSARQSPGPERRHRCCAVRCVPHIYIPPFVPLQSKAYAPAPSQLFICRHQRHFNK